MNLPSRRALRRESIQLHVIFDNLLDSGVSSDLVQDILKSIARAASKHQHQVIFTMQSREAPESVGNLNGATTRIAPQQDHSYGAYRWNEKETVQLIQTLQTDKPQDEIQMSLKFLMIAGGGVPGIQSSSR